MGISYRVEVASKNVMQEDPPSYRVASQSSKGAVTRYVS